MEPVFIVIKLFGIIYATIGITSAKIFRKYAVSGKKCDKKSFLMTPVFIVINFLRVVYTTIGITSVKS
jgi:hypothetical protein